MALAVVGNSQIWWLLKTGGLQRSCEKSKHNPILSCGPFETPHYLTPTKNLACTVPEFKKGRILAEAKSLEKSVFLILTTLCLVQVSYTVHAHCVSLKACVNIQLIFNARHWELSSWWGDVLQFYCDTMHRTRRLYKNQRTARIVSRMAHSHTYPTPKPEALWTKS